MTVFDPAHCPVCGVEIKSFDILQARRYNLDAMTYSVPKPDEVELYPCLHKIPELKIRITFSK